MPSADAFKQAVFMGDSLTVGMSQNVNGLTVFATVGHNISQGRKTHLKDLIAAKPSIVVISYGTNDAGYKNPSKFKEDYISLINDIKKDVSGVAIYINKIFPGDETKASGTGLECIKNIPSHNEVLAEVASSTGATLLDCTNIPELKSYYSSDGVHFNGDFYKLWYEEMQRQITSGANSGGNTPITIQKKLFPSQFDGKSYSSKSQNNTYIVIHNTAGCQYDNVSTAAKTVEYFFGEATTSAKTSAHFCIDDKEIYQILELNWKGHHTKGNGEKDGTHWGKLVPANNGNSVGIEIADGPNINHEKATEIAIELTRHIMKELNITSIDAIARHGDTQPKECPYTLMKLKKDGYADYWEYFLDEVKKRNESNKPIDFGTAAGSTNGVGSTSASGNYFDSQTPLYGTPTDIEVQLPDVDHRENTVNMDEIKGVSLMFYPPFNSCEAYDMEEHFKSLNWDRNYHYTIGKINSNAEPEPEGPDDGTEDEGSGDASGEDTTRSVLNMRSKDSKNRAYIYNIGDGLCVFIRNDGTNILIDCGEQNKAVNKGVLDHISALGISTIHHVILTHFHSDHVAGFKDFANKFTIENVYYKDLDKSKLPEIELSDTWKTDKYYDEVLKICKDKQINETKITEDKTVSCVKIFAGDTSDDYSNYNSQSLSMIVTMNNKKLFIAGDIIESTEKLILSKLSKCDAMIIAHHGYAGSNCQEILDKVDASNYFVTTYITDDDAHKEVIDRVSAKNSNFYSTHNNKDMILLDFNEKEIIHNAENKVAGTSTPIEGEGDPVGGTKTLESVDGFEIKAVIDELRQTQAFTDNDTHTYIDRALFQNKRQKHNLTVALMCPDTVEDYPTYEKAMIEGLSIILHEHGLEAKDLWREFDLNRAPSPFLYLERDLWKDLLTEVEKQVNWRNKKFGKYAKQFEKYSAGSSGLSGGGTGSINPGTIGSGGGNLSGSIGGGDWTNGQVGGDCLLLIKGEEGFSPNVYTPPEGGGNLAIGYGCTKFPGTPNADFEAMKAAQPITEEMAAQYLAKAINTSYAAPILDCCKNELKITKQCQFDALVSVSYNAGPGSITNSSSKLHQAIKKNPDDEATIRAVWESYKVTAKGKHMPGLVTRRKKECDMYFGKAVDFKKIGIVGGGGTVTENGGKGWLPTNNASSSTPTTPDNGENNENENNTETPEDNATTASITPRDIPSDPGGGGSTTPGDSTTTDNGIFGWPLPGYSKVSSKFGPRKPPCPGASSNHGGIDIGGVPRGTPILAYAGGVVEVNKKLVGNAGNYIKIDHGNGVASRYLHMDQQSPLAVGTTVQAGQEVGKVGSTGVGTGVHLHFEIWINGTKVDPLLYVNPGGGTKDNPNINPGQSGVPGGTGQTITGGAIGADSSDLLYDDKKQENTNAPIGENSAGDVNHDDWGGKMIYQKGEPEDESAEQPEIQTIVTHEMYLDLIQYSDPKIIDDYTMDFEPYSKGLATIDSNIITPNDRVNAMTKKFITKNENTFHYKVIESGPGSKDHCVTIAEELNYIVVPDDLRVEPIYPDLVIPPGYVSTDADASSPNTIPVAVVERSSELSSEMFTKQLSFDYDVLKDKVKSSNKTHHPVNYTDPYPYDDKITDLEKHYPKVFIDEIESQLYSCNHPGCPISQPMAKNFAMLSDALMNQSKRIEKRLSRLENILSTVIRNQGRLGARMNINCVYYGGHSTFNKYKCIRCLHDDRVHDGELVTIDQCLNCTRFEPILGQVYKILDDSGLNGSIILDDMQMSYTNLEGFKNLNDITHRSSRYFNATATAENNCKKPEKDLITIWKEADKEQAVAAIKNQVTDATEAQKQIDALKEEDYVFKMDWTESFFNSQEPDTKLYPNEGIVARHKVQQGDGVSTIEDEIAQLDPEEDKDEIERLQEEIKIRDSIWVDTRNLADAVQVNKYTSENFLFEDFNKVRVGKYGIKFSTSYNYNGEDYSSIYSVGSMSGGSNMSNGGGGFASDVRNKIVEMAKQIVADYDAGKAKYSQSPRTVDYTKPQSSGGKVCYDCTSFVSCCYMHAGLKSMYAKSCSGKTLVQEILKGGEMFLCNEANLSKAKPGDVLVRAKSKVTEADMGKFVATEHAMIYIGDGKASHASSPSNGIKTVELGSRLTKGTYFFCRPADLIEADKQAAQQATESQIVEQAGTINNKNYVAKIPQAVCTAYTDKGKGSSGMGCTYNATCASHNMPYGTKIYIPDLAGKAGEGVYTVTDCGGPFFDFDINTNTWNEKINADAYVLEWGTGKNATSYSSAIDEQVKLGQWDKYKSAWGIYKNMNGKLMNFTKFNTEDTNIKSHSKFND